MTRNSIDPPEMPEGWKPTDHNPRYPGDAGPPEMPDNIDEVFPGDGLDQVFGARQDAPAEEEEGDLAIHGGYAFRVIGEAQKSAEEAAAELGEASTLPDFLFGFVDTSSNRAVVFFQVEGDEPKPTAARMMKVPFVIGPTFLRSMT